MERIRVLIADDHPIFLEGFCSAVNSRFPELEIVAAVCIGRPMMRLELAPAISSGVSDAAASVMTRTSSRSSIGLKLVSGATAGLTRFRVRLRGRPAERLSRH